MVSDTVLRVEPQILWVSKVAFRFVLSVLFVV